MEYSEEERLQMIADFISMMKRDNWDMEKTIDIASYYYDVDKKDIEKELCNTRLNRRSCIFKNDWCRII